MSLFSWMSVFKYNFGLLTIQNKIDRFEVTASIFATAMKINLLYWNNRQGFYSRESLLPVSVRESWMVTKVNLVRTKRDVCSKTPDLCETSVSRKAITSYVFNIACFYAEVAITFASCDWEWASRGFKPRGVHSLFSILIWNFYGIN